jgi:hypothetical protein
VREKEDEEKGRNTNGIKENNKEKWFRIKDRSLIKSSEIHIECLITFVA